MIDLVYEGVKHTLWLAPEEQNLLCALQGMTSPGLSEEDWKRMAPLSALLHGNYDRYDGKNTVQDDMSPMHILSDEDEDESIQLNDAYNEWQFAADEDQGVSDLDAEGDQIQEMYGHMMRTSVLTRTQEQIFIRAYRYGESAEIRQQALNDLFYRNSKLVIKIARKLSYQWDIQEEQRADVVQEGFVALMQALDSFDVTLGFTLSTYATPKIFKNVFQAVIKSKVRVKYSDYVQLKGTNVLKPHIPYNYEDNADGEDGLYPMSTPRSSSAEKEATPNLDEDLLLHFLRENTTDVELKIMQLCFGIGMQARDSMTEVAQDLFDLGLLEYNGYPVSYQAIQKRRDKLFEKIKGMLTGFRTAPAGKAEASLEV